MNVPAWRFAVVIAVSAEIVAAADPGPSSVPCTGGGPVVDGVLFTTASRLVWQPLPDSQGYNLYRSRGNGSASFTGLCLYSAIPETSTLVDGHPSRGEVWMFQVTALLPGGEGSMGFSSDCAPRAPAAPCTCTLPADPGPCDGVCPRWYHDAATGQCAEFMYGCCGGNANNFETEQACAAACRNACRFPAVMGSCGNEVPRWYFSVPSGHCEPFVWSGCGGNANNYPDEQTCRAACGDLCFLPPDPGPCTGVCPRWYFDPASGQCAEFIYGCCGGNLNNFRSRAECEAECQGAGSAPSSQAREGGSSYRGRRVSPSTRPKPNRNPS